MDTFLYSVCLIPTLWYPPYYNIFPYSKSALFKLIFSLKMMSALIQLSEKSVRLIQAVTKIVSALFQHHGICLIPTYSNTQKVSALFLKFFRLITGVRCPPYYSLVSVLLQHSVHLIPTSELSALLQDTVRLNVGTQWSACQLVVS